MVRTNYEWDSEYRWYTFYCEFCEHATTIGEPINEEYHLGYENGIEHEPLTSEELGQDTHDKYKKSSSHQFSTKFKEENR